MRMHRKVSVETRISGVIYVYSQHSQAQRNLHFVVDYFLKTYGMRLTYGHMPCINTKGKTFIRSLTLLSDIIFLGKNAKSGPELYPLEVCRLVARQPVRGKLNDNEVAAMIRASAQPADETFKAIKDTMQDARKTFDTDLSSIGLEVSTNMEKGNGEIKI